MTRSLPFFLGPRGLVATGAANSVFRADLNESELGVVRLHLLDQAVQCAEACFLPLQLFQVCAHSKNVKKLQLHNRPPAPSAATLPGFARH